LALEHADPNPATAAGSRPRVQLDAGTVVVAEYGADVEMVVLGLALGVLVLAGSVFLNQGTSD